MATLVQDNPPMKCLLWQICMTPSPLAGHENYFCPGQKQLAPKGQMPLSRHNMVPLANPIPALERYVQMNAPPPGVPLFAYCVGKKHFCLTSKKFLAQCNI